MNIEVTRGHQIFFVKPHFSLVGDVRIRIASVQFDLSIITAGPIELNTFHLLTSKRWKFPSLPSTLLPHTLPLSLPPRSSSLFLLLLLFSLLLNFLFTSSPPTKNLKVKRFKNAQNIGFRITLSKNATFSFGASNIERCKL